jgi:hypothetical protein
MKATGNSQKDVVPVRGRKLVGESRAAELRQRLISWKAIPESSRPSLRALAHELGTSHQLLKHYLDGLEKWQSLEYLREAIAIRSRAIAEDRPITQWEEQRANNLTRAGASAFAGSMLRDCLERLMRDAKYGPLHPAQFKTVKFLAKQGFPGAHELLQKCLRDGLKKRKRFAEIVKETPRREGEECGAWVRRIWDQCDKYDTNCPAVLSEELLEKYSRDSANNRRNNLPAIPADAAKSFRTA